MVYTEQAYKGQYRTNSQIETKSDQKSGAVNKKKTIERESHHAE